MFQSNCKNISIFLPHRNEIFTQLSKALSLIYWICRFCVAAVTEQPSEKIFDNYLGNVFAFSSPERGNIAEEKLSRKHC